MKHFFIIDIIVTTFAFSDQKKYQKEFYTNGQIEKEGWVLNNSKIDF
jgi:hypothetical protein